MHFRFSYNFEKCRTASQYSASWLDVHDSRLARTFGFEKLRVKNIKSFFFLFE
jgi:hypothetical protein